MIIYEQIQRIKFKDVGESIEEAGPRLDDSSQTNDYTKSSMSGIKQRHDNKIEAGCPGVRGIDVIY